MIGCAGMDTPNLTVVIMVIAGLAIMGITAYKEFSLKGGEDDRTGKTATCR